MLVTVFVDEGSAMRVSAGTKGLHGSVCAVPSAKPDASGIAASTAASTASSGASALQHPSAAHPAAPQSATPHPVVRAGLDDLLGHALRLKAVFTDLDGTFLTADHLLPPRTSQIVDRLQATGVRFVPTSGRTVAALRGFFGNLLDRIDYVAGNGMDVVAGGVRVAHREYARDDVEALLDATRCCSQPAAFVVFGADGPYLMDLDVDFARSCIESLEHAEVRPLDRGLFDGPIAKVALIARRDAGELVRELEPVAGDRFDFAPCGANWIDVLVKGVDKIDGIRAVMGHLGAAPDEVAAFGDSLNDLGMMRALPLSVAVSNAMEELKPHCAFEIGSNADGAVPACLERIAALREAALRPRTR